ncbi:AMP-binding protein, partial [uncultured Shewanella sp.]|uniref:AMP-binding protein n=1 Tax=uncultured Shewanella sp. TaxID=173975 RepID=UPI0026133820
NQLARYLRAQYQARLGEVLTPDTLITLYLDRSLEMVISILAVLKAGGAYVPVSPEYPEERTRFIVGDTQSRIVLCNSHYMTRLGEWLSKEELLPFLLAVDGCAQLERESVEDLSEVSTAQDLAYVIYTSGTTGQPKGVM